ncbi:MAG: sensor histidine kinase [Anaerolineae bacterium]
MMFQSLNVFGKNHTGRITTQPVRFFAFALYISIFIVELIFWGADFCGRGYQLRWLIPLMITLGVFAGLEYWEQRTFSYKPPLMIAIALIGTRIVLTELSGFFGCSGFHQFFAFIPPLLAYLYIGRRGALITAGLSVLLYLNWAFANDGGYDFSVEHLQDENILIELFIFLVGIVLVLVLGRVLTLEEKNRERAEGLLAELEASQKQITDLAKVTERNRIARDIHDSVGHHLTAINIQIEKAQAFRAINPAEADQALVDAKRSAQAALADVRESVSALRDQDRQFDLKSGLTQLVDGFSQVPTTLHFEGDETLYSKASLIALYRVAQEGLTNIGKHAQATAVDLTVSLNDDYGTLILKDNGVGLDEAKLETQSASKEAHFGLIGLEERLELVGGTLTVQSEKQKGTTLNVRVPARGLG